MAATELTRGKDRELRTLAQNRILARQREISEMRKQLGGHAGVGNDNARRCRGATASAQKADARGQRRAPRAHAAEAERFRGQAARDVPYAQAAR